MFKKIGKILLLVAIVITVGYLGANHTETSAKALVPENLGDPDTRTEIIEKENIDIDGRHYEYIQYCRDIQGEKIRIMSLHTKEDVLIIPAKVDGEPVVEVGIGSDGPAIYASLPEGTQRWCDAVLLWQTNEQQKLKKIVVSEGIKQIVFDAFVNTKADCLELPKSLTNIGEDFIHSTCFFNSKIKHVVIKGNKTNVAGNVFAGTELEKITLPKNYQGKIGPRAFEGSKLEKFTWPAYKSGVTKKIDVCAFKNCKNLKEVIFPKNQKYIYIPEACFFGCKKLKKLTFPASTKKVTYRWNPYGDNYKMGPGTLVFKGKKTGIAGTIFETGKQRTLLTVGKIIAPKNSKAIKYAKKAKRIKTVAKKTQKDIRAHRGPTVNFIEEGSDSSKLAKMRYSILKK